MRQFSQCLPSLPGFAGPKTYASWRVWRGSTRKEVKFHPLPKKQAATLYNKARAFDRATKVPGKHGGAVGRTALKVLETLVFDFLNYASGRLDPSYEEIARKANVARSAVGEALKRLKRLGILHWERRSDDHWNNGRWELKQVSNAYAVLPATQWVGHREPPPCPSPHPATWGATPMVTALDQAVEDIRIGMTRQAALQALESDAGDELAAVVASYWRHIPEGNS